MPIEEDPSELKPLDWIRRGLRLPVRELFGRAVHLALSTARNLWVIARLARIARHQGKALHFIILADRLGDVVAAEPTLRVLRHEMDYVVWAVRPPFAGLLEFNPNVDAVMMVSSYTETLILRRAFSRYKWINLYKHGVLCNKFGIRVNNPVKSGMSYIDYYNYGPLVDVYSIIGTGSYARSRPRIYADPNFRPELFLSKIFREPERPLCVLHPMSDEKARSWSGEKARSLAAWMMANTDFNLLEVGLSPVLDRSDRVYPLRDELPLSRQIAVVARARLFIGVDSGFAHVANSARVRSILLIGQYGGFTAHLPWRLNATDLVLRADGQAPEISLDDVTEAIDRGSPELSATRAPVSRKNRQTNSRGI